MTNKKMTEIAFQKIWHYDIATNVLKKVKVNLISVCSMLIICVKF